MSSTDGHSYRPIGSPISNLTRLDKDAIPSFIIWASKIIQKSKTLPVLPLLRVDIAICIHTMHWAPVDSPPVQFAPGQFAANPFRRSRNLVRRRLFLAQSQTCRIFMYTEEGIRAGYFQIVRRP